MHPMKTVSKSAKTIALVLFAQTAGVQAYGAQNACVNASQLWKWVDGRNPRVLATASCAGPYFKRGKIDLAAFEQAANVGFHLCETGIQNLGSSGSPILDVEPVKLTNDVLVRMANASTSAIAQSEREKFENLLPETQVNVFTNGTEYIDEGNAASTSIAQAEAVDHLKLACANVVLESKGKSDPTFNEVHSVVDIKNQISVEAPAVLPSGTPSLDSQFAYTPAPLTDIQKEKITGILNELNSCDSFSITNEQGVQQRSNCTLKQEADIARRVKNFKKSEMARLALSMFEVAVANGYRGGEFLPSGDAVARAGTAGAIALVRPIAEGGRIDWGKFARDFALTYAAEVLYTTHGFVSGGQKHRGIGSHGASAALATGAEENARLFAEECNGDMACAAAGIPVGAIYVTIGKMADGKYKFLHNNANTISEVVTGAVEGFALAKHYFHNKEKALKRIQELSAEAAHVSSQDLCVDVSDVL